MIVALLTVAAALVWAGFAWLALAMPQHWEQVFRAEGPSRAMRTGLRVCGTAALLTGLWVCSRADHWSMAALVWVMYLAAAVVSVALLLTYRARWLRWIWPFTKGGRPRQIEP
jgi:hypothetical protein